MHMLFTGKHASPFDINMAVDAGFDVTMPYTNVAAEDVEALVQDCIFSRKPNSHGETAFFIGGRDVNLTEDMLDTAGNAMFAPFQVGLMADPNGAYTTSAALVALSCAHLRRAGGQAAGSRVLILGGGPVGMAAAVLLAREEATVTVARLTTLNDAKRKEVDDYTARFDIRVEQASAADEAARQAMIAESDIVISTAKAGIQVVSNAMLDGSRARVLADVNAVPPAGIEPVSAQDNGKAVNGNDAMLGLGALAIGDIKYKTQSRLLKSLIDADAARRAGLLDAYQMASDIVSAQA